MTQPVNREQLSEELHEALTNLQQIPLISARYPDITIEDAYHISLGVLERRKNNGERVIGKKIGLTAKPIQQMLGIDEPDFGFLTDAMQVANGATIRIADYMMTPMVEAEIAFVLKDDLTGSNITAEQVLAATDYVTACFELVDTRFDTQKMKIFDTVSDNASSALFVLGDDKVDPNTLDLAKVHCDVRRNNVKILEGDGVAVMGTPVNAIAWLANRLGNFGVTLNAGDIVLPGALAPFAPIAPGETFEAEFSGIGSVKLSFE